MPVGRAHIKDHVFLVLQDQSRRADEGTKALRLLRACPAFLVLCFVFNKEPCIPGPSIAQ